MKKILLFLIILFVMTLENVDAKTYQGILIESTSESCTYKTNNKEYSGEITIRQKEKHQSELTYKCSASFLKVCQVATTEKFFEFKDGTEITPGVHLLGDIICPKYIYYTYSEAIHESPAQGPSMPIQVTIQSITITSVGGKEDKNTSGVDSSYYEYYTGENKIPTTVLEKLNCNIFSKKFGKFLSALYNLLKFAVPIIILVYAIIDFLKAMAAQDPSDMKKAANKLVKRLIIGVAIFVLPTILDFTLRLAGVEFGVCPLP